MKRSFMKSLTGIAALAAFAILATQNPPPVAT